MGWCPALSHTAILFLGVLLASYVSELQKPACKKDKSYKEEMTKTKSELAALFSECEAPQ